MKGLLAELMGNEVSVVINCDNQSALHLMKNPMYHKRSKHIDIKLYFIRDIVASGRVQIAKVAITENPVDALTKMLPRKKFEYCLKLIQLKDQLEHFGSEDKRRKSNPKVSSLTNKLKWRIVKLSSRFY